MVCVTVHALDRAASSCGQSSLPKIPLNVKECPGSGAKVVEYEYETVSTGVNMIRFDSRVKGSRHKLLRPERVVDYLLDSSQETIEYQYVDETGRQEGGPMVARV